ncbi:hypothetical protein B0H10DRAFT_1683948, partial [Mycena sp. CBHHK59/15]
GQEAAVDLSIMKLLDRLRYAKGRQIIMVLIQQSLPLLICGLACSAPTDVCIIEQVHILLLARADKRLDNNDDPEPQIIADAIAVFQRNNRICERDLHLPLLDRIIIP